MSETNKVARVYITEGEREHKDNLYKKLFSLLHDEHQVDGVTVCRGVAGFGSKGEIHSSELLRMRHNLPLVIEFHDSAEKVDAAIRVVRAHIPEGRIISWTVEHH